MSVDAKDSSEVAPFLKDVNKLTAIDQKEQELEDARREQELSENLDDGKDITCGFWIFKGPTLQR